MKSPQIQSMSDKLRNKICYMTAILETRKRQYAHAKVTYKDPTILATHLRRLNNARKWVNALATTQKKLKGMRRDVI